MPNRLLKESICTSDNVDRLSLLAETAFYRLIVNCDDYGRFDGRLSILKSRLYPLKKHVTEEKMGEIIKELAREDLIMLYSVGGKPYLQMKTWNSHQQVRAKKSKYPEPPMISDDIECDKLISNDIRCEEDEIKCPRNPIQSESESESESKTRKRDDEITLSLSFGKFWDAYPKKVAKQAAIKAWRKLKPDEDTVQKILTSLSNWKKSFDWQKDGGQFIPYPATFINGRRWEDEVPAGKPSVSAQAYTQRDYGDEQAEAMRRMIGKVPPAQRFSQRDYSNEDEDAINRMLATGEEVSPGDMS